MMTGVRSDVSTVLLVDDDDAVRNFLSAALERAGHKVIVASNGANALDLLRQTSDAIRLLITDIEMPGMSGLELAALIRQSVHGCAVLLISGKPLPPEAATAGWEFLAKPFQVDVFLRMVNKLLQPVEINSNRAPDDPLDRLGIGFAAAADSKRTAIEEPALRRGERLRVIIAEDDTPMRDRLCSLIRKEHAVAAAFENGEAALAAAKDLRPDIILLDISMPGMNGFQVARILRRVLPAVPVIIVTQHTDKSYVDEAFRNGAAGFVAKRNIVSELPIALQQVCLGVRYVSPIVR